MNYRQMTKKRRKSLYRLMKQKARELKTKIKIQLTQQCLLVCVLVFPDLTSEVHPLLGEKIAYATTHLHLLSYVQVQRHLPLRQLHSDFRDFNNGVCQAVRITTAGSQFDMGLLKRQTFGFSPSVLVTADMMSVMTMSVGSDGSRIVTMKTEHCSKEHCRDTPLSRHPMCDQLECTVTH